MKRNFSISVAILVIAAPMLYASHTQSRSPQYVQGTVLAVQKHVMSSPGDTLTTPTDAPLSSRYYAYDVAIQVDCETYTGRYETAFDYLPSAFTADQPVRLRLTKHSLYFNLPNNPHMRMGIVRRTTASGAGCSRNR